jgi:uncharacterized protein (TIGR03000 family)
MRFAKTLVPASIAMLLCSAALVGAQESQGAYIRVQLPTADTKFEVQGIVTKQEGASRFFKSPPLDPGKSYAYDMKATWMENGKQMVRQKTIQVMAGMTTEVDFRTADGQPGTAASDPKVEIAPKPHPMVEVKVVPKVDPKADPKVDPKANAKTNKAPAPEATLKLDAPYVPSPEKVVEKMLEMAKVKEGDVVYDLGCGDGRIVITAVSKFNAKKGVGVDIDPARIKDSNENAKKAGVSEQTQFVLGDIFKLTEHDLSDATVVTLYLKSAPNARLMPILKKLKPGTRIVSHDYGIGDWEPDEKAEVRVPNEFSHSVYSWIVK